MPTMKTLLNCRFRRIVKETNNILDAVLRTDWCDHPPFLALITALEATQGQMDGFLSQLLYKCYLFEVAFVRD